MGEVLHNDNYNGFEDKIKNNLGLSVFESWFTNANYAFDENTLSISVKDRSVRDWIVRNYKEKLTEIFECSDIMVLVKSKREIHDKKDVITYKSVKKSSAKYLMSNFLKDENNILAYDVAEAIVNDDSIFDGKVVQVVGSTGNGKTHLLQAIANESYLRSKYKATYMSSEKFMFDYISSIKQNDLIKFRNGIDESDVLIIDDMQNIDGKKSTSEELNLIISSFADHGKKVVISSNKVESNVTGSMIVNIGLPNRKTRRDFAMRIIADRNASIPLDVVEFLVDNVNHNMRELESAIATLIITSRSIPINLTSVKEILQDVIRSGFLLQQKDVRVMDIQKEVAEYYDIEIEIMLSNSRMKHICRARQVGMYLSKKLTSESYGMIASKFNISSPATVLHSCMKIKKSLVQNSRLAGDLDKLERIICS